MSDFLHYAGEAFTILGIIAVIGIAGLGFVYWYATKLFDE